ncbi:hypothetical protein N9P97_02060 [Saprospiraceae bacterium]|nr:hypothetical protein [Saprospiraceae bacterium]
MKPVFIFFFVLSFLIWQSSEAQLGPQHSYNINTSDTEYCKVSMAHWFGPTVQVI